MMNWAWGAGSLAALGLSVGLGMTLNAEANPGTNPSILPGTGSAPDPRGYPPVRTGLRGSHPGAYETAHAIALDDQSFPPPRDLEETYDLVVVGAGIGGHARRNEFHQAGPMRLSLGGTHNLEWWNFSNTVRELMAELGVDVEAMRRQHQFDCGPDDAGVQLFAKHQHGARRPFGNIAIANSDAGASAYTDVAIDEAWRAVQELPA